MRVSKGKSRPVKAIFRIRGQDQNAAEWPCADGPQAMQQARRVLPHFEQRNPWLYCDSRQQKLNVLLDPETEEWAGARHPKRTSSPVRIMPKKGDLV
jgi:hypothetical protein